MKSLSRRSPPLHRALGSHQCPLVGGNHCTEESRRRRPIGSRSARRMWIL